MYHIVMYIVFDNVWYVKKLSLFWHCRDYMILLVTSFSFYVVRGNHCSVMIYVKVYVYYVLRNRKGDGTIV